MNIEVKKKILKKIVALESDIERLKECRLEVATSGYASVTLASSGGSKSFTRVSIQSITELINQLTEELNGQRALLKGASIQINTIATVYC